MQINLYLINFVSTDWQLFFFIVESYIYLAEKLNTFLYNQSLSAFPL